MIGKSIKGKIYKKNKFKKTRDHLKLNFKYPEKSIDFLWVLRARYGYKFDARFAKVDNKIEDDYPERFSCCYREYSNPQLEHWFSKCYLFR